MPKVCAIWFCPDVPTTLNEGATAVVVFEPSEAVLPIVPPLAEPPPNSDNAFFVANNELATPKAPLIVFIVTQGCPNVVGDVAIAFAFAAFVLIIILAIPAAFSA